MRAATPHPEPRQSDGVIEGLKALEHTLPASNGLPSHGHGRGFYVMSSPILFRNSLKQDLFPSASIFVWDYEDTKWYEAELSSGVINTWIIVVGRPVTTRITWTWCWWSIKGCNYFGDFPMPNVNPFGTGHVIYVTLYLELTSRLAPHKWHGNLWCISMSSMGKSFDEIFADADAEPQGSCFSSAEPVPIFSSICWAWSSMIPTKHSTEDWAMNKPPMNWWVSRGHIVWSQP